MTNSSNPWRTVVLTVGGIIALVFLWVFWTNSSGDMRALVVGIGFGVLVGIPVGIVLRPRPDDSVDVYTEAYARGLGVGRYEAHCAMIAQEPTYEVVIPQQARELVPVRR